MRKFVVQIISVYINIPLEMPLHTPTYSSITYSKMHACIPNHN